MSIGPKFDPYSPNYDMQSFEVEDKIGEPPPQFANSGAIQQTQVSLSSEASQKLEANETRSSKVPVEKRTTEPVKKNVFSKMMTKFRTWRSKVDAEKQFKKINSGLMEAGGAKTEAKMTILKDKIGRGHLDFGRLQELKGSGSISDIEFAKASVYVFKNQANEEKGLMDILCEKDVIVKDSDTYNEVFADCLTDPNLADTPIVALEIPEDRRVFIDAKNDSNTNPDPEFCRAVMDANTVEGMVSIYNTFFNEKITQADNKDATQYNGITKKSYYEKQKDVLCGLIFKDIHRCPLYLQIGEKKVTITGNSRFLPEGRQPVIAFSDEGNFKKLFENILTEIKEQGGLSDEQALQVMKQLLLAYRGQNGTTDFSYAGSNIFDDHQTGFLMKTNDQAFPGALKFSMHFDDQFNLTAKEECQRPIGFFDINTDGYVSSEVRFKFPGEEEVRTELPVRSERKETGDGTIQWSCPFRENPPERVILYGGCKPPVTS
jgi:hypothetical protein